MRLHTVPWLLAVLVTGALSQASDASLKTARSGPASPSGADWREGEVIVAFHEEIDIGSVEKRLRSGGAVAAGVKTEKRPPTGSGTSYAG